MAPCVVVERLEGKQQFSRAPVGGYAEVQAQDAECGCHEQQEVNEKRPKPRNSPSHNHDSMAPRQHPLIYTDAGPIHPVHGPLRSPATEAIASKGFTFSPLWWVFLRLVTLARQHGVFLSPLPVRTHRSTNMKCGENSGLIQFTTAVVVYVVRISQFHHDAFSKTTQMSKPIIRILSFLSPDRAPESQNQMIFCKFTKKQTNPDFWREE